MHSHTQNPPHANSYIYQEQASLCLLGLYSMLGGRKDYITIIFTDSRKIYKGERERKREREHNSIEKTNSDLHLLSK